MMRLVCLAILYVSAAFQAGYRNAREAVWRTAYPTVHVLPKRVFYDLTSAECDVVIAAYEKDRARFGAEVPRGSPAEMAAPQELQRALAECFGLVGRSAIAHGGGSGG